MKCRGYILPVPSIAAEPGKGGVAQGNSSQPCFTSQPKQIPERGIFSLLMVGEMNQWLCAEARKYTIKMWKPLLPGTVVTFDADSWGLISALLDNEVCEDI